MVVGLPSTDVNTFSIAGGICRLFLGPTQQGKVIFISMSPSILLSFEALFSKVC